jgi:hypothetical protein
VSSITAYPWSGVKKFAGQGRPASRPPKRPLGVTVRRAAPGPPSPADPARWGQGLAGAALDALLCVEHARPLYARVAEHNIASGKVLARAGFVEIDRQTSYADGVARDVIEHICRRER